MARYIDADITVRAICGTKCGCERNECGHDIPCQQVQMLETSPTADVVPMDFHEKCLQIEIEKRMGMPEVVQCKYCKYSLDYYHDGDCYCKTPTRDLLWMGSTWDGFCSYGERKPNDN